MRRCLNCIDAAVVSRDANGTRHVRPDTQSGTAIGEECRRATCRSTGSVFSRVRICGPSPDIRRGFEGKQSNRNVRFDERIGTSIAQEPDDRGILLKRDQPGRTGISDTRCKPCDPHGVFHADGQENIFWVEVSALNVGDQRRYVVVDDLLVCRSESSVILRR